MSVLPILATLLPLLADQPRANPDSLLIQHFEEEIAGYEKLRQRLESQLPPLHSATSSERIAHHERELARKIREARKQARQGDIFTSQIAAEFRRLIGLALTGQGSDTVPKSLRRAEPVRVRAIVNGTYPAGVPLESTPPTMLLNLPELPEGIQYRVSGNDLLLIDVKANLILDYIDGALR